MSDDEQLGSGGDESQSSSSRLGSSDDSEDAQPERPVPVPVPVPPQLVFDDGSRVMMQEQQGVSSREQQQQQQQDGGDDDDPSSFKQNELSSPRGLVSIRDYYEIDRLVNEIQQLNKRSSDDDTRSMLRIALQFPDELLQDAPCVCWEFEQNWLDSTRGGGTTNALVFCLGDTTYAPCCPDQVAAAHLQADCLVHYGHACLSSTTTSRTSIPVLYSFGGNNNTTPAFDVNACVQQVLRKAKETQTRRILLLYQVEYLSIVEELQTRLSEQGDLLVIAGQVPSALQQQTQQQQQQTPDTTTRCDRSDSCCQAATTTTSNNRVDETVLDETPTIDNNKNLFSDDNFVLMGGLELPSGMDWSSFAFLFVGDDTSRQYLNIVLRFLSAPSDNGHQRPKQYWTWNPTTCRQNNRSTTTLVEGLSPSFQRKLNRRFYLVQKARHASLFGILVANLSSDDMHVRTVVTSLRQLIEQHGRSSYTFCVGKINAAKLANFAEIDCFVLVACAEHALLDDERTEFPVPILTPLELSMALGVTEWGDGATLYSLDTRDYLRTIATRSNETVKEQQEKGDDDDDAPYFSLVTGQYESAQHKEADNATDLSALPGQGKLTTYSSAAADFLKQREYQGLEVQPGSSKVQAAVPGERGIASNYGER